MKYTIKALMFILFFTLSGNVLADQKGEIRLTDGSIFYGEIASVKNGVYVFKTENMGTLKINKSKVASISFGSIGQTNRTNTKTNNIKAKTESLTNIIKNNKNMMSSIMSLQNHPDFKNVLNDPVITQAINSGNIIQLLSNPKIQKLMNNKTIKDITGQLSK